LKESDKILHIGAGNSLLAEQILGDDRFPSRLSIENVDVSPVAVDRMNDHLDSIFGANSVSGSHPTSKKSKKKAGVTGPSDGRPWSRDQISYKLLDVSDMPHEDESYDVVLDKGMLDAVLSHGEVETGENELVKQVNREVFRVLKTSGYYIIISGMDSFLTMPYFLGDENVDWDVSHHSFKSRSPSNKTLRTLFFYILKKKALLTEDGS